MVTTTKSLIGSEHACGYDGCVLVEDNRSPTLDGWAIRGSDCRMGFARHHPDDVEAAQAKAQAEDRR